MLCDQHITKMAVETAQILSTALRENGCEDENLYKRFQPHNRFVYWVRPNTYRASWLTEYGLEICNEYKRRYGTEHGSKPVLEYIRDEYCPIDDWSKNFYSLAPFPRSEDVPDTGDIVADYRNYYKTKTFATWEYSERPEWV